MSVFFHWIPRVIILIFVVLSCEDMVDTSQSTSATATARPLAPGGAGWEGGEGRDVRRQVIVDSELVAVSVNIFPRILFELVCAWSL